MRQSSLWSRWRLACQKKSPADETPHLDYEPNLASESSLWKKYDICLRKKAYLCLDYLHQLNIEDAVEHNLPAQQFLSHLATGMTSASAPIHLQHIQVGKQRRGVLPVVPHLDSAKHAYLDPATSHYGGTLGRFKQARAKVTKREEDGRNSSEIRGTIMKPNQALNNCGRDRCWMPAANWTPLEYQHGSPR